ncbi:E-selectin-like isoform X2 [Hemibagrus wyckioides]|nr:E-selectin-like isoform X2 [Hemibagrus wyckioides]XP_058240142.1 E-selectin-like isoform X2 [Hemibagrus wyckioides]XP_058240143.1 E-selectin-like isoform X2 [Hemibagrus wyckioides]
MKLNLFLLCLTGVVSTTLQDVRRDYYLIKTPMIWADARTYCEKNNKNLAMMQTADDWNRLTAEAERHGLTVTGWVGLYNRVGIWYFTVYGAAMTIAGFHWATGQPDNFGGNETCVAMNSNGTWADYPCTDLKPCICYSATLKGFTANPSPLSWSGSQVYCRTYHTALASPKNVTQNDEFQQLVSPQGTSWIGINRLAWTWTNGSAGPVLPWRPGYPNNADRNSNCGFVNNSLLEDKPCNNKYYFFCHTPYTVRKQVLKLKIQGDNSVFDATSQAVILQQFKQKLMDLGITREMNVTWRVQPDGSVFQKKSGNGL